MSQDGPIISERRDNFVTKERALELLEESCLTVLSLKERLEQEEERYKTIARKLKLSKYENVDKKFRFRLQSGRTTSTIKKELLQSNGVSIKVIEKSTVTIEGQPFYVLQRIKEKEEKGAV